MSSGGGLNCLTEIIDILAEYGQLVIEQKSGRCDIQVNRSDRKVVDGRGGRPSVMSISKFNGQSQQENSRDDQ